MLHRGMSSTSLLDAIVSHASKSGFYGLPSSDAAHLRTLLETNLQLAVEIGTRYKDQVLILPSSAAGPVAHLPPSRVEFSPSTGASSLPTFTIHPPAAPGTEPYVHPGHHHYAQQHPQHHPLHHSPALPSSSSSPIGALSSMINSQQPPRPSAGGGTNGILASDSVNHGALRQGWSGGPGPVPGAIPYQQQGAGVQNTAVVVPMQYGQRAPPGIGQQHQRGGSTSAGPATSSSTVPAGHHAWPSQQQAPSPYSHHQHHQMQQQQQSPQQQQQQSPYHHAQQAQHSCSRMLSSYHHHHGSQLQHQIQGQSQHYRSQPPSTAVSNSSTSSHHPLNQPQPQPYCYQSMDPHAQHLFSGNMMVAESPPRQGSRQTNTSTPHHASGPLQQQQRMRQLSANSQPSQQHAASLGGSQILSGMSTQPSQPVRHLPIPSPPTSAQQQQHQQRLLYSGSNQQQPNSGSIRRISQEQPQPQLPQQPVQPSQSSSNPPLYTCLKCGKEAHQKCSGCQTTFYCSRSCQVKQLFIPAISLALVISLF